MFTDESLYLHSGAVNNRPTWRVTRKWNGQQCRCKVKQETIDLKFLLGSAYTRMIFFFKLEGVVWLAMTDKTRKQYFWSFLISAMYSANGVLKKI